MLYLWVGLGMAFSEALERIAASAAAACDSSAAMKMLHEIAANPVPRLGIHDTPLGDAVHLVNENRKEIPQWRRRSGAGNRAPDTDAAPDVRIQVPAGGLQHQSGARSFKRRRLSHRRI